MGTKIEWTGETWNTVTGCTQISPGCDNCYALAMTRRQKGMGTPKYAKGFDTVVMHEDTLDIPLRWRKATMVFVNSMSDLFHKDVSDAFIQRVFGVMRRAPRHTFQVLTKRAHRLERMSPDIDWPQNVWMGVSVETAKYLSRMDHLRRTGAVVKFLSLEPLLGTMDDLDLEGIDWVIVGGESGQGARPMKPEWVMSIRDQCLEAGVPFFFKQWGGRNKKKAGRILEGWTWDEMPKRRPRKELDLPLLGHGIQEVTS